MSEYLGEKHLRALEKVGDVMIPGDGELPSFSESGCVAHIDGMLRYLDEGDLNDLKSFLGVFAFLPRFMCRRVVGLLGASKFFPNFMAGLLRFGDLGIKGVVYTLYYSGKEREVFEGIRYDLHCEHA